MTVCGAEDDGGRKALFVMIRNVPLARRERLANDVPGADTAIRTTDHHDQPGPSSSIPGRALTEVVMTFL